MPCAKEGCGSLIRVFLDSNVRSTICTLDRACGTVTKLSAIQSDAEDRSTVGKPADRDVETPAGAIAGVVAGTKSSRYSRTTE